MWDLLTFIKNGAKKNPIKSKNNTNWLLKINKNKPN